MSRPHETVGVAIAVDLLDEMRKAQRGRTMREDWWNVLDRELWRALGWIKRGNSYFPMSRENARDVEVCLNHQCWVRFYPRAATWAGIARETERVREQLLRAVQRATDWSTER